MRFDNCLAFPKEPCPPQEVNILRNSVDSVEMDRIFVRANFSMRVVSILRTMTGSKEKMKYTVLPKLGWNILNLDGDDSPLLVETLVGNIESSPFGMAIFAVRHGDVGELHGVNAEVVGGIIPKGSRNAAEKILFWVKMRIFWTIVPAHRHGRTTHGGTS